MKFSKYHGLGNDYLVIEPQEIGDRDIATLAKVICDRNYGVGGDGILVGPYSSQTADFRLRIINPDGSEAEKSGNGLRIFSRYLWDEKHTVNRLFTIETAGGNVKSELCSENGMIRIDMGKVSFWNTDVGITGAKREVINEPLLVGGRELTFCAASIGNPHCVILGEEPTKELACEYGPKIEVDPRFMNRTNVQFLKVIDSTTIEIEIWERGAGYTFASGSSSTAAAAVAYKLDLCGPNIKVRMPGGHLCIEFGSGMEATMTGSATKIANGWVSEEILAT